LATSSDLIHWAGYPENPVIDLLQLVDRTRIHDLVVWKESGLYLGLLQVGPAPACYEFALVLSRDGIHFSRPEPAGIFLPSGSADDWDPGSLLLASAPVAVGDEWWFYYGANDKPPTPIFEDEPLDIVRELWGIKMSAGIAAIRRGGYAHFEPATAAEPAYITTVPLTWSEAAHLHFYCNATVNGSLRAEVVDARTGEPCEGYAFADAVECPGDSLHLPLRWKHRETVAVTPDAAIRLRFELRGPNTCLYGVSWGNSDAMSPE